MNRPVTAEDRRRAVEAALRRYVARHGWVLRITEGQRRAILAGTGYGPKR